MIPIINNTNIENRIETRVIELSSLVEYLEELDQDHWTCVSALHDQIKLMKSDIIRQELNTTNLVEGLNCALHDQIKLMKLVINRQELNTKNLVEGLNCAVNEINRLSRKKEKFSCHHTYIMG